MPWYGSGICAGPCCRKGEPPPLPEDKCPIYADDFASGSLDPTWQVQSGTWNVVSQHLEGSNGEIKINTSGDANGQIVFSRVRVNSFAPVTTEIYYPSDGNDSLGLRLFFDGVWPRVTISLIQNGSEIATVDPIAFVIGDWNNVALCYKYSATDVSLLQGYIQTTAEDPFTFISLTAYVNHEFAIGSGVLQTGRNIHFSTSGTTWFDDVDWTHSEDNDAGYLNCPPCPTPDCVSNCIIQEDDFNYSGVPDPTKWIIATGSWFVNGSYLETTSIPSSINSINGCTFDITNSYRYTFEVKASAGATAILGNQLIFRPDGPTQDSGYIEVWTGTRLYTVRALANTWIKILIEYYAVPEYGDPLNPSRIDNIAISFLDANDNVTDRACLSIDNTSPPPLTPWGIIFGLLDAGYEANGFTGSSPGSTLQIRNFKWEIMNDWDGSKIFPTLIDCPEPYKCASNADELLVWDDDFPNTFPPDGAWINTYTPSIQRGLLANEYLLTIAGVANDVCTNCSMWNDSFLLDQWRETLSPQLQQNFPACTDRFDYVDSDSPCSNLGDPGQLGVTVSINNSILWSSDPASPLRPNEGDYINAIRIILTDFRDVHAVFIHRFSSPLDAINLDITDFELEAGSDDDNLCNFAGATLRLTAVSPPACGFVGTTVEQDNPHDHIATNPDISKQTQYPVADSGSHDHIATTPDLNKITSRDPEDGSHDHIVTIPDLLAGNTLDGEDGSHDHIVTEPAFSSVTSDFTIGDTEHDHIATIPNISAGPTSLPEGTDHDHIVTLPDSDVEANTTVATSEQDHIATLPTILAGAEFIVESGEHDHVADTVAIIPPVVRNLDVENTSHDHLATIPEVEVSGSLTVGIGIHEQIATMSGLSVVANLTVANNIQEHAALSPALTVLFDGTVTSSEHSHICTAPDSEVFASLTVSDSEHFQLATGPTATVQLDFDPVDASHDHTGAETFITITVFFNGTPENTSHEHIATIPTIDLNLDFDLDDGSHDHIATSPALTVKANLTIIPTNEHEHIASIPDIDLLDPCIVFKDDFEDTEIDPNWSFIGTTSPTNPQIVIGSGNNWLQMDNLEAELNLTTPTNGQFVTIKGRRDLAVNTEHFLGYPSDGIDSDRFGIIAEYTTSVVFKIVRGAIVLAEYVPIGFTNGSWNVMGFCYTYRAGNTSTIIANLDTGGDLAVIGYTFASGTGPLQTGRKIRFTANRISSFDDFSWEFTDQGNPVCLPCPLQEPGCSSCINNNAPLQFRVGVEDTIEGNCDVCSTLVPIDVSQDVNNPCLYTGNFNYSGVCEDPDSGEFENDLHTSGSLSIFQQGANHVMEYTYTLQIPQTGETQVALFRRTQASRFDCMNLASFTLDLVSVTGDYICEYPEAPDPVPTATVATI